MLTAIFSIIGTLQLLAEPQVFRSFTSSVVEHVHPEPRGLLDRRRCRTSTSRRAISVVLALVTFALSFAFLKFTQRKADA